jgi:hypothetical protein
MTNGYHKPKASPRKNKASRKPKTQPRGGKVSPKDAARKGAAGST